MANSNSTPKSCPRSAAVPTLPAFVAALLLALGGCATCRDHPVACGIAGAVVAGSIAATIESNRGDHRDPQQRGLYSVTR
jgi:hypothetical protein